MTHARTKLKYAVAMAVGILLCGTLGYHFFLGWPVFDSFYMTVITLTTVGFSEIRPLNETGRMFTIFLIAGGVITITYTAQVVVRYIVEENFFSILGRNRMQNRLARLRDHIIICGYGRIGRHVLETFMANGRVCVVVDSNAPESGSDDHVIFVRGDATDEEMLVSAGLERAAVLIPVVGSDADNLFITMTARGLNPKLRIISRATDGSARAKLLRAGADSVVLPYEIGGRRIAGLVLNPSLVEFLDITATAGGEELHFEEIVVCEKCWFNGKDILTADVRRRTGAVIIAVKKHNGKMITNPSTEMILETGDRLLSLGTFEQMDALRKLAAQ
jgi:voltage-gated potassium channel